MHIQNTEGNFEPHEAKAFNSERKFKAEKCLEKILIVLKNEHPRPKHIPDFPFSLPWESYYPE